MQSTRGSLKMAHVADAYPSGVPVPSDAAFVTDAQAELLRQRQAIEAAMNEDGNSSSIVEIDTNLISRESDYDDLTLKVMEQSKQIEEAVKLTAQEQLERERERLAQLRTEQMQQFELQVQDLANRGEGYNGSRVAHQLAKNAPGSYTIHWVIDEALESAEDIRLTKGSAYNYNETGCRVGTPSVVAVDTSRVLEAVDDPTNLSSFSDVRILQLSVDGYVGCKTRDLLVAFPNLMTADALANGFVSPHGSFHVMPEHAILLQQKRDAGLIYLDPLIAEASRLNNRGDIEAQVNEVAEGRDDDATLLAVLRDTSADLLKHISNSDFVSKERRVVHIYIQREVASGQIMDFSQQADQFVELYSRLVEADKDSVASPTKVGGLQDSWYTVSETHWNTFVRNLGNLAAYNPSGTKNGVAMQTRTDLHQLLTYKFAPTSRVTAAFAGSGFGPVDAIDNNLMDHIARTWGRSSSKHRERFIVHGTCTFIVNK